MISQKYSKYIVHNRRPLICGRWIFENVQNSYWFYFVFQSIFQTSSLNNQHLWALNVLKWRKSGWVLLCFYSLFSNDNTAPPPHLWALNVWKSRKGASILLSRISLIIIYSFYFTDWFVWMAHVQSASFTVFVHIVNDRSFQMNCGVYYSGLFLEWKRKSFELYCIQISDYPIWENLSHIDFLSASTHGRGVSNQICLLINLFVKLS